MDKVRQHVAFRGHLPIVADQTHLLRSGVDINTSRAWLGRLSLTTANMYAEVDLEMKANALETGREATGRAAPGSDRQGTASECEPQVCESRRAKRTSCAYRCERP